MLCFMHIPIVCLHGWQPDTLTWDVLDSFDPRVAGQKVSVIQLQNLWATRTRDKKISLRLTTEWSLVFSWQMTQSPFPWRPCNKAVERWAWGPSGFIDGNRWGRASILVLDKIKWKRPKKRACLARLGFSLLAVLRYSRFLWSVYTTNGCSGTPSSWRHSSKDIFTTKTKWYLQPDSETCFSIAFLCFNEIL